MIFASDFDGTLFFLDQKVKIRPEDREAIADFRKRGNRFGLCTGRTYRGIIDVLQEEPWFDFYILATGATILDQNGAILLDKQMDNSIGRAIFHEYETKAGIIFQGLYTAHSFTPFYPHQVKISSFEEIQGGLHGLSMVFSDEEEAIQVSGDINHKYQGKVTSFSNRRFVDVVPFGCSKGEGIRFIRNHFHDKVAGIGDSYNDLPLLKESDISFTFRSSPKSIQSEVDHTVKSVAEALNHLYQENNDGLH